MEEEVRDAVFGNVGTTVVFRVSGHLTPRCWRPYSCHDSQRRMSLALTGGKGISRSWDRRGRIGTTLCGDDSADRGPARVVQRTGYQSVARTVYRRASGIEKAIIEELAGERGRLRRRLTHECGKKPVQYTPPIRQSVSVAKPFAHRPPALDERSAQPIVPRPLVATKNAEDLKTILRNMTAKLVRRKRRSRRNISSR